MNRIILSQLQTHRSTPSVSLLMPTHRNFPDNLQDKIRLKNLINEAIEKLKRDFSSHDTKSIIKKLNSLNDEIDINHLEDGLAVFISSDSFYKFTFSFPVKERVIIDDNFITRDLIFGLNRTQPYFAVVIDDKNTRIFNCVREKVKEAVHTLLPLKNIVQDIKDGNFPDASFNDRVRENDERLKNHLRDTMKILKELNGGNPANVVICGTEKQISFFREICASNIQVIAEITGNYGFTSPSDLSKIIWPEAKKGFAEIRNEVIKKIDAAVSANKFATGIQEIWNLANEGRGLILLVEINFAVSGIIGNDHVEVTDSLVEGATEDIIDELIENVVSKGGNVVFFDNDSLEKYGRIAMILRY